MGIGEGNVSTVEIEKKITKGKKGKKTVWKDRNIGGLKLMIVLGGIGLRDLLHMYNFSL